jgi:hypothetical protein
MWALKRKVSQRDRKTAIVAGERQAIGAGWVGHIDLNVEERGMENILCEMQSYTPQGLGNTNAVVGVPSLHVCKMMHREG